MGMAWAWEFWRVGWVDERRSGVGVYEVTQYTSWVCDDLDTGRKCISSVRRYDELILIQAPGMWLFA
jgi:hypothetical protein